MMLIVSIIAFIAISILFDIPNRQANKMRAVSQNGKKEAWVQEYFCINPPCEALLFSNGELIYTIEEFKRGKDSVDKIEFTQDGKYLVALISQAYVSVYDGGTGNQIMGRYDLNSEENQAYLWSWVKLQADTLDVYSFDCKKRKRLLVPRMDEI